MSCECSNLGDFAVVPMGDCEGFDARVFSTVEHVVDHGGDQWWLYASHCSNCGQDWLIAREDRIHDNYYLERLSPEEMRGITEQNEWPPKFLQIEEILRLGPDHGEVAIFLNPDDLTDTVKELIEARQTISLKEVAYLFALQENEAQRLMDRATRMSWAQLRPFAKL